MTDKKRNRMVARVIGVVVAAWLATVYRGTAEDIARSVGVAKPPAVGVTGPPSNPLDAQRAYGYLLELCAIGPRPSGSAGMHKQQALLEDFFKKLGGKVTLQRLKGSHPQGGEVAMANIIVEWHPERKE